MLTGLPPAPRGMPQIEVTFDIDANGIVHVSAKDLGTGKEQSMTITGGSALPKDDIEQMIKDAEAHAAEDAKRRESAELRNQADTLVYQTETTVKEHGDKLDEATKADIEQASTELRDALKGDDADAISTKMEALATKSQHSPRRSTRPPPPRRQPPPATPPGRPVTATPGRRGHRRRRGGRRGRRRAAGRLTPTAPPPVAVDRRPPSTPTHPRRT